MKRKLLCLLMTSAVMAVATITGCGGGSSGSSAQGQPAAKSATVTFSANFAGTGGATKSLIPAGTQAIEVYSAAPYQVGTQPQRTLLATLTVANPTVTITTMAPGNYNIFATAFDSTDSASRKALGSTASGGTIVVGANSVELTFLGGTWTLSSPIELSNGTILKDLVITPENFYQQGMYKKSAFDPTKPYGFGYGQVFYRFTNHTTGRSTGHMFSQFNGASKPYSSLGAGDYNITRKCSTYDSYSSCRDRKGDTIILIPGDMDTDNVSQSQDNYVGMKQGSAYELLPKSEFTQNGTVIDPKTFVLKTTITNGTTITGNLIELKVLNDLSSTIVTTGVTSAKTVPLKAAQSANTATKNLANAWYEPIIYNLNGGTNKGGWQFYGSGTTTDGKTYYDGGYLQPTYTYDPVTGAPIATWNAGDYSYGLVPKDKTKLGEYCAQFDYSSKTCNQVSPSPGDIYYPWNFWDFNGNGVIDYGSFAFQFYRKEISTFDAYNYAFTATGK